MAFDDLPGVTVPDASQSGPVSFVPAGLPSITHAKVLEGIAAGGYIRGVMVEAQKPGNRATRYAFYVLTSWQLGYHVFHTAWPSRPRLFKDPGRFMEMLRFESQFLGTVSVRLAGEQVAQKSARLRIRREGSSNESVES